MATHAYKKNPESPPRNEIYLGHTRLQGRPRRERTLVTSRKQKLTSNTGTSGVPGGHPRNDTRGRGKRRYEEGTRDQYRGNPD